MPIVELIYDSDCPNFETARKQLRRAFAEVNLEPEWREWNRGASTDRGVTTQDASCGCEWEDWNQQTGEIPAYVGMFGSPTILVDGQDVAGETPSASPDCCRVYRDADDGFGGVPPVEAIVAALREKIEPTGTPGGKSDAAGRSWWVVAPAVGLSLLPNVTCPACWPAYAALLSSLGVSVTVTTKYLFPLTLFFVALAVISLGWRARRRHGFGPLIVGLVGAGLLITGRFYVGSNLLLYSGMMTFIAAAFWNGWPRKKGDAATDDSGCPNCQPLVSLEIDTENPLSDNARHGSVT